MQQQQMLMQQQMRYYENAMQKQRAVSGLQAELMGVIQRIQSVQMGGINGAGGLGGSGLLGGQFQFGLGGGLQSGGLGGLPGGTLAPPPLSGSR
jgi:hypothetical protein